MNGENGKKGPGFFKFTGFVRRVEVGADGGLLGGIGGIENVEIGDLMAKGKGKPVSQKEEEALPVVEFPTPDGGKEAVLVTRVEFRVEDLKVKLLARRCIIVVYYCCRPFIVQRRSHPSHRDF